MSETNTLNALINLCVQRILSLPHSPCLVAITGESGSGKSYFIKALSQALAAQKIPFSFLNHDDFLIPRNKREELRRHIYTDGEFNGKTYWEVLENWYYYDAFEQALDDLRRSKTATYYPYIHSSGETSATAKVVPSSRVIIIEDKILLDKMDFVIELVVDRKKIIERKIDRDSDVRTPGQTIEMHEKAQGYFWDRQVPVQADVRIDNNDFARPKIITD
jgi:uridine kinase